MKARFIIEDLLKIIDKIYALGISPYGIFTEAENMFIIQGKRETIEITTGKFTFVFRLVIINYRDNSFIYELTEII